VNLIFIRFLKRITEGMTTPGIVALSDVIVSDAMVTIECPFYPAPSHHTLRRNAVTPLSKHGCIMELNRALYYIRVHADVPSVQLFHASNAAGEDFVKSSVFVCILNDADASQRHSTNIIVAHGKTLFAYGSSSRSSFSDPSLHGSHTFDAQVSRLLCLSHSSAYVALADGSLHAFRLSSAMSSAFVVHPVDDDLKAQVSGFVSRMMMVPVEAISHRHETHSDFMAFDAGSCRVVDMSSLKSKHELLIPGIGPIREAVMSAQSSSCYVLTEGSMSFATSSSDSPSSSASDGPVVLENGSVLTDSVFRMFDVRPQAFARPTPGHLCEVRRSVGALHDGCKLVQSVPIPSLLLPCMMAMDDHHRLLFVANASSQELLVVRRDTLEVQLCIRHGLILRGLCCIGSTLLVAGFHVNRESVGGASVLPKSGTESSFSVVAVSLSTLVAKLPHAPQTVSMASTNNVRANGIQVVEEHVSAEPASQANDPALQGRVDRLEARVSRMDDKLDMILELLMSKQSKSSDPHP
jgi:hypothetical protein